MKSEFGVIGLGVMGTSISRNLADKGFSLSLYNQRVEGIEESVAQKLISKHEELKEVQGFEELGAFIESLERPRKILLMVKAGEVVDVIIDQLVPLLAEGDIIIDGGNSHYKDTERRASQLAKNKLNFIGTGVSGGEEGALKGPAIMAGGTQLAYNQVSQYLESIAATDGKGGKCCARVGNGGAGHFVKMVHNGIEYAEMQLIAEVFGILKNGMGYTNPEITGVFKDWLTTDLNSYLLEITVDILNRKEGNDYLLDQILDKAGNKGTGGWTTEAALQLGVPIPTITAALFARYQSSFKADRIASGQLYDQRYERVDISIDCLNSMYKVSRIINHHQGFHLIREASNEYDWGIDLSELARIWTNGCIIRSQLMSSLVLILNSDDKLLNNSDLVGIVKSCAVDCSEVVAKAIGARVPIPCITSSANYLNAYLEENSSANLIQAQRDYFGAHTYQRKDDPEGPFHHSNWKKE